jgi:hypothetical protein
MDDKLSKDAKEMHQLRLAVLSNERLFDEFTAFGQPLLPFGQQLSCGFAINGFEKRKP